MGTNAVRGTGDREGMRTVSEHNYFQQVTVMVPGDFRGIADDGDAKRDPNEIVTFSLTLPRGVMEDLYWFDMEASDAVYADIEGQLIAQGFLSERHRRYGNG